MMNSSPAVISEVVGEAWEPKNWRRVASARSSVCVASPILGFIIPVFIVTHS